MYETSIDLPLQTREAMTRLLNARLADTIDLSLQIKQAHWNVKGPSFIALHELFDRLHREAIGFYDDVAERITALGGIALGSVRSVTSRTALQEYPADIADERSHVRALAASYAELGKSVRTAIGMAADAGDADTSDLFTGLSRGLDKTLWLLEAHLKPTS